LGGRVHVVIEGGAGLAALIQAGTLRAIAVGSNARLAEFPDLPTVSETIPEFYAAAWIALVAPAGTSPSIVRKISDDMRTVLSAPSVRARLTGLGSYPRLMTPEEATAFILNEQRVWSPMVEHFARAQKGE
jgi:tripartite-type tricarboxylate transporter receptor subunit TctC